MKRLLLPFAFMLALGVVAGPASAQFTQGVASGDVTSTSAILWTRVDGGGQAKVEVWDNPGLTGKKAFQRNMPSTSAASDFTVKIDATGLTANTTYYYRFKHETGSGTDLSPVGTFKTAPISSSPAAVRFTVAADSDGTINQSTGQPAFNNFEVLDAARQENADFFVYLGDTIYADSSFRAAPATTIQDYWGAYKQNRSIASLPNLLKSTSTYADADDHEVVNDYDGQTVDPARYAAGIGAFLDYMPVRETGLLNDPTCAGSPLFRTYKWGSNAEMIVLDERSCRSPDVAVNPCLGDLAPTLPGPIRVAFGLPFSPPPGCLAAINDPTRTLLGPVQKQALKNALLNSTAAFKFILNPEPIQQFWALPYDRWEGYAAERNELLSFIEDNDINNTVFLTTDMHATLQNQVYHDRFENCTSLSATCAFINPPDTISYELVSGPIATNTFQQEILNLFGPTGPQRLEQFNQALDLAGVDCRDLNRYSYALASAENPFGIAVGTIASKDANGAVITDKRPGPESTGICQNSFEAE